MSAPQGGEIVQIVISGSTREALDVASKTFIEEQAAPTGAPTYTANWAESGEQLGIVFGDLTKDSKLIRLDQQGLSDGKATFTGEAELTDGSYNVLINYPYSAFAKAYDGSIGFNLKAEQAPVLGSFDPTCDLMVYTAEGVTVESGMAEITGVELERPMAILRVNLNADETGKAYGQTVTGFQMKVPEGITLTGRPAFNADGTIKQWNVKNNYVKATIDAAELITVGETDGFNAIYLVVNPAVIPAAGEITFTVETEDYSGVNKIERTVKVGEAGMAFEAGKVNVINLKIRDKDVPGEIVEQPDYSGDWLITGVKDEVTYAALAYASGNNIKATAPLTFSEDRSTISSNVDLSTCKMTLTLIEEGTYAGMYTIQDANGKYLYAASNSANYLKGQAEPNENAYWTIEKEEEGTFSIVATKSSNRNIMQFNPNGSNDAIVSCYASTDAARQQVTLYPWSMVNTDTPGPVVTTSTISEILAGGAGTYASVENLLVYAVSGSNAIVGDSTGKMLLYKSGHGLEVGDIFSITDAVVAAYQTVVLEITGGTFSKKSSGNAVDHGTPVDLDNASAASAQQTAFSASGFHSAVYVGITGAQNGRNISNDNAVLFLNQANTTNDGKQVTATGYIYAYNSSYKNFNFHLVNIEEISDPDKPSISADVTSLTWAADEYGESAAKTIKVTLNANASGYTFNWGVGRFDVFDFVDNGDNTVSVYPIAANTSTAALESKLRICHKDDPDNLLYAEISLTQNKAITGAVPDPETINLSTQGYANQQEVSSVSGDNITISFNKGTNSNTPMYYNTGTAVRVYGGGNMKVSAKNSHTISKIEITFGSGDGTNTITTADIGTYSNGTWTGSESEVVFSVGGTTGHRRFKSIKVTFSN